MTETRTGRTENNGVKKREECKRQGCEGYISLGSETQAVQVIIPDYSFLLLLMTLSEDERMRRVLDKDEHQQHNETRYADIFEGDISKKSQGDAMSGSGDDPRMFQRGNKRSSSASNASSRFYDWPHDASRGIYSRVGDGDSHSDRPNENGILSIIAVSCLPGSHPASNSNESRGKRPCLPALLLGLILYGSVSIIMDVTNSISSLNKFRFMERDDTAERFPGGFVGMSGPTAGSTNTPSSDNDSSKLSLTQTRSFDIHTAVDEPTKQAASIDVTHPTMTDVPHLTEQILSTTFQHVLEYNKSNVRYENEVLFFWTFGNTMDHMFKSMLQCFPHVVQAVGGAIVGGVEESLRKFPAEIKILQQKTMMRDSSMTIDAGRYVNVDLFTPEGVKRSADLDLLFPKSQLPLIHEHDYSEVLLMPKHSMAETTITGESTLGFNQIQLMVSPFLPEVVNGLFSPTDNINSRMPPPKAKVHSILLPTGHRLRSTHHVYTTNGGTETFIQFITSPRILVNNYVTRILSGQWEEGSKVTEVHLEIAKNVVSRKIHMWPNRGVQDMVSFWANFYGWQNQAVQYREQLMQQLRQQQGVPQEELILGMECVFPPPDPNLPPPVRGSPQEPSDLDVEINKILAERNALDDQLFLFVVQLYDSWMA